MPSLQSDIDCGQLTAHEPASHEGEPTDQNGPSGVPASVGGTPESGLPLPASSALASATVHVVPHVPQ